MLKIIQLFLVCLWLCFSAQPPKDTLSFPKIKSSIAVPVRIPLASVSQMVNNGVGDLLYQDDSYTDNNNDQFKVKVWKTAPIRLIGGKSQNLIIEVPLKIWAEKGIGTLGVYTYQNTTFETTMYFNTTISFNNNWTITSTTVPGGYKWVSKPVLDYGKIKIPITPLVEKSLLQQQADFCKVIDQKIAAQLNLQPYILQAWNAFLNPIQISAEYNTWLKITPIAVNVSPLVFYSNAIDLQLGVDTYSETFTGYQPASSTSIVQLPKFNVVQKAPDYFLLQTTANIPYSEATHLARKTFLNKDFDFKGGKIKIADVKVYRDEDRIMLEAQTEGAVKGTSFISGIPVYDAYKKKIVLTDTKFKLRTSNILQKAATLLFKGKIVKMIEDEYGIPTKEIEDMSRKSIVEALNKEYQKGLRLSGKVNVLQPSRILLTDAGITAVIDINAGLQLQIQSF